ncbi:hypothetical protein OTU49_011713, partial [Cherax quadricarinatus]
IFIPTFYPILIFAVQVVTRNSPISVMMLSSKCLNIILLMAANIDPGGKPTHYTSGKTILWFYSVMVPCINHLTVDGDRGNGGKRGQRDCYIPSSPRLGGGKGTEIHSYNVI